MTLRAHPRWWLLATLVASAAAIGLTLQPLRVESDSMRPTIAPGDRLIVEKVSRLWSEPTTGEIVVLHEPGSGGLVVKRVVAEAGDLVGLEDGQLVVNGVAVDEPYVDKARTDSMYFGPVRVPDRSVFVMGDDRGASIDSRAYGAVPIADVVGRVLLHL